MINVDIVCEKTIAFTEAYRKVSEIVSDEETVQDLAVGERIDENYFLVSAFGGEFWAIAQNDNTLIFWYGPDDDFTFGDMLGGYLDLVLDKDI